uniref:TMEM131 second Ig-like domain-containing protein n=1 Tax=Meloidogyne enterolobii TaxID=390850 RepID=A0A6V7VMN3_MELEN|nr:unnamed protein product [Meloidogyne enterolobii]
MCLSRSYFLFLSLHSSCILCLINEHLSSLDNNKKILSFGEDSTDAVYHAFVQIGSELHYFQDISYQDSILLPIVTNKKLDSHDFTKDNKQKIKLFEEEVTDFGITTFGVLVHRIIYITNPGNSKIVLSNILSSGINFYCSSSFEKNLMPKQRISFHIYFLPTSEEPPLKEEILSLFTSIGVFVHKVRGKISGNSYRIKTLSNIRLPINSTFSTSIQLHNPHFSTLRILEIFSSDCNIQLEFPTEFLIKSNNSIKSILLSFETRKIAVAKIIGNVERNTTSFIFIKYSLLEEVNDENERRSFYKSKIGLITIPVETQVTLRRDLFSTTNLLDFGLVKAGKQFLSPLKLTVFSTLEKSVEIDSIYSDKSKMIYIQYETHPPISLKSATRGQQPGLIDIANINIDTFIDDKITPKNNNSTTKTKIGRIFKKQGKIMAVSRGGNFNVTVPFIAQLYEGELEYNLNELSFHKNLKPFRRREIILTNTCPFPLAIFGAEIEENGKDYFEIFLIESPIIISPGQSLPSLIILFKSGIPSPTNFSSSHIILNTNLTNFQLPLYIFDGEINITLHSIEQNIFNFGLLKKGENRSILFTLFNPNPIAIEVLKFNFPTNLSNFITLQFIEFTNLTFESQQYNNRKMSNQQQIKNVLFF